MGNFGDMITIFSIFYLFFISVVILTHYYEEGLEFKEVCGVLTMWLIVYPLFVATFALIVKLIIFISLWG